MQATTPTKRRADANYPADTELVALMVEHGSFSRVAAVVGVRRESLRDFLSIRPDLDARMREHLRPRLTPEQRRENNRTSGREYARRVRADDPERARRVRREQMRKYGPDYRQRWNHYNRLRRAQVAPPDDLAHEYAAILRLDPCSYCGRPCEHIDHVEAVASGGDGSFLNLTAACADCNRRKQARPLLMFMLARGA